MHAAGTRSALAVPSHLAVLLIALRAALPAPSHAQAPVIACVDPQATLALTDAQSLARHDAAWQEATASRGRCHTIEASERWEPVYSSGGLVIMRRTPPRPGIPPLYFRADRVLPQLLAPSSDPQAVLTDPGTAGRAPKPKRPDAIAAPVGSVRIDPLPPLPTPSLLPQPQPQPPASPSALVVSAPVPPPVVLQAPPPVALPPVALPPPQPAVPAPAVAPADAQAADGGYAVGFGIAIILIVLLLTGLALFLRMLLRAPPDIVLPAARASPVQPTPASSPHASASAKNSLLAPREPDLVEASPLRPKLADLIAGSIGLTVEVPPEEQGAAEPEVCVACASLLRDAGWETGIVRASGRPQVDVIARRAGRILALRCLPAPLEVDEEAIEEACLARERERADLGVIVSNGPCSNGARKLAAQTGIDLLREEELPAFAGQGRPAT